VNNLCFFEIILKIRPIISFFLTYYIISVLVLFDFYKSETEFVLLIYKNYLLTTKIIK